MITQRLLRTLGIAAMIYATTPALAQSCLENAQRAYDNRRLNEAIHTLEACRGVNWPGMDTAQKTSAFRLLAIAHFARGEPELARVSVEELLGEDRGYRANPEMDPLFFQDWVDGLRPRLWYQKRWVQVTGVTVISSLVAIPVLMGGKKPPSLPGPPTLPGPPH